MPLENRLRIKREVISDKRSCDHYIFFSHIFKDKGSLHINILNFYFGQIQVIGSYGGRARQDLPKLIRLAETGIFNLDNAVSRRYSFEDAGKAFQDLNEGKIVGRAVIEI